MTSLSIPFRLNVLKLGFAPNANKLTQRSDGQRGAPEQGLDIRPAHFVDAIGSVQKFVNDVGALAHTVIIAPIERMDTAMRNNLLATLTLTLTLTLTPALALAIAWAVEQRFEMPIWDALAALVA